MIINVKRANVFIPEFNGNRDLPDNEQIKFHHGFLTTEEREEFVYVKNFTQGGVDKLVSLVGKDFDLDTYAEANDREVVQDSKGIAKKITTKIENLVIEDESGAKETLDTIEKFYAAPDAFSHMRAEYESYVLNLSAKADSKN